MTENPHEKDDLKEESEENQETKRFREEKKTRSYYYDDACGYEIFTDEEDEESED